LLREPWPQGGNEPRKTGLALPAYLELNIHRQRWLTVDEAKVEKREELAVEHPKFEEPDFGDLRTFRSYVLRLGNRKGARGINVA
jgi:hypothetical protein